jgi:hypothetical protein
MSKFAHAIGAVHLQCVAISVLQAGLAMFKLVESQILKAERMEEVFELWKDQPYQPELVRLMLTQYEEYASVVVLNLKRSIARSLD